MNTYNNNTKFSEELTIEKIASWQNENVILDGGTGTGKTHFILHTFASYQANRNKKILYLCNRTALLNEIKKEVEKHNIKNVEVATYQSIETQMRNDNKKESEADVIVCDEFHHILETYNRFTDLSYEYLIDINNNKQKIFISATAESLIRVLKNRGIVKEDYHYKIEKNYNYVTDITLYAKDEEIEEKIDFILNNTDDNLIFFADSINTAISIYDKYKNEFEVSFICSDSTDNEVARKYLKANKDIFYENENGEKQFKGRMLVATQVLDVGISLEDIKLKHIISEIFDIDVATQCIGRKRVKNKSDKVKLYLKVHATSKIENLKKENDKTMKMIRMFRHDIKAFAKNYLKDRNLDTKYIYNDINDLGTISLTLNEVAYLKVLIDDMTYNEMLKIGYNNYLIQTIKLSNITVINLQEVNKSLDKKRLISLLDEIEGKHYKIKDLATLLNLKKNGEQKKQAKVLNEILKSMKLDYEILDYRSNKERYVYISKLKK